MIAPIHFRKHVIRPILQKIGLWSEAAENLLLGTALAESRLTYLRQHGEGPALGLYQMEPATHDDIWKNFLDFRNDALPLQVDAFLAKEPDRHAQLVTNLAYATAMVRVHYLRRPEPLPAAEDVFDLAAYWKQHYNTPLGAGRVEKFVQLYEGAT